MVYLNLPLTHEEPFGKVGNVNFKLRLLCESLGKRERVPIVNAFFAEGHTNKRVRICAHNFLKAHLTVSCTKIRITFATILDCKCIKVFV